MMKNILFIMICFTSTLLGVELKGEGKTGENNYVIDLKVVSKKVEGIEKFSLTGSIFWDRGMYLTFTGNGTLNNKRVLEFTFKDELGNSGKGELFAVKEEEDTKGLNPHYITMNTTKVGEPRAARQYFDYLLLEKK